MVQIIFRTIVQCQTCEITILVITKQLLFKKNPCYLVYQQYTVIDAYSLLEGQRSNNDHIQEVTTMALKGRLT